MEIFTLVGLLDCQSLLYKELSKGEEIERCLTNDFIEKEPEVTRDQNLLSGKEAGCKDEI